MYAKHGCLRRRTDLLYAEGLATQKVDGLEYSTNATPGN